MSKMRSSTVLSKLPSEVPEAGPLDDLTALRGIAKQLSSRVPPLTVKAKQRLAKFPLRDGEGPVRTIVALAKERSLSDISSTPEQVQA